jgi:hypothetical protein
MKYEFDFNFIAINLVLCSHIDFSS